MNKDEILTFIKKNIISLICGLMAILSLVAIFYPLGGMQDDLTTQANQHAADYSAITALTKPRKLPMSDPTQTDPGSLVGFPTPQDVKAGEIANKAFSDDSEKIFGYLLKDNQAGHSLLVPDELPKPLSDSTYFNFAKLYKLVLSTDPGVSINSDPDALPPVTADPQLVQYHQLNIQNDVLHGGLPPSIDEIKAKGELLWKNTYEPQLILQNGVPVNAQDLQAKFTADAALLPLRLKADSARKHKIYVEKDAFTISPNILPDRQPQLIDMWYAQMQLWIQQDLASAIAKENHDSHNVLDAPIKRLISLYVPSPQQMYVVPPATTGGGTSGVPSALTEKEAIPPIYSLSPTGRYSNAMYDVIPFRMVIDVDATKVNHVIETISHSQLININVQNEYALSAEAESAKGYLYGAGAAVRLQLDGEIVYLRAWTKPLMPEPVQVVLGLMQPKAGMAPGQMNQPGGGMMMPPGGPGGHGGPMMPPQR